MDERGKEGQRESSVIQKSLEMFKQATTKDELPSSVFTDRSVVSCSEIGRIFFNTADSLLAEGCRA